jgi:transposase-like protein
MRPVCVFANGPVNEIELLQDGLRGQWRQATRAVMVLLSLHGLTPAQIAELLECHPSTVRRWIGRFSSEGLAGLADRPRCGRPWLGGHAVAQIVARLIELPRRAVVLAEDETHLNLLPHVRASWTPRGARPQIPTPGTNRQVTVFGALEVTTGAWVYRLGRRCAADFVALLDQVLRAFPAAPGDRHDLR